MYENRRITLYRAADEPTAWSGSHFADHEDDARAYLDNPGFGGARLFRYDVTVDRDRVADASGSRGRIALAEYAGYEDPEDQDDRWRDAGLDWVFHVLDNRPDVEQRLKDRGYLWVVYDDDYPEGMITWRYLGPDDDAPRASREISTSRS